MKRFLCGASCAERLCTGGSNPAPARGPSTSPLGVVFDGVARFLAQVL